MSINISNLKIKLTDSPNELQKKVKAAIADKLNSTIAANLRRMEKDLIILIKGWLAVQPEMIALATGGPGSLPSQLGLVSGSENRIKNVIINSIADSAKISFTRFDRGLKRKSGNFTITCQPQDYSNLISLPEADVRIASGNINWLQWLLEAGNKVIVVGYKYSPTAGQGRSRGGVMAEGPSFSWRVPPQYAGTVDDNFITRALSGKEKSIQQLLERYVKG